MSRYCSQCGKSRKACICQWIVPLANEVELIILQHMSEEHRPLGTARILNLSLNHCTCLIGEDFSDNDALNALLEDDAYQHFILYPSEQSLCLSTLSADESAAVKKIRLILLDGTWKKAYKMWQLSTNLHAIPTVKLPENLQGHYTIRKAPSENSLSTVEAGYHALSLVEPDKDFEPLLTAFEKMIEFQIAQMPPGVFEKNYLKGE
ncbi:DTW domain-containing protein [Vibrio rotiferianus]|uniref:tRNA-uridine aminocarboxypropyltransferase n=1 Tax=Vibrio rotiferianus TaxID=190895 RepID=A0A510I776_9VIBR|nr:DTW domain-containing protein [Vibrio rotiferianus]TMX32336.1 DTW domain-containing protein [Vibrio rotiferianus]TMX51068.1 DTW domain-containing protein [Vibrio rotiferianus]TMX63545.1 DTW domain-containing protein [Vibrio rotiferianus]BBL88286.1 DTW domain-containing protein [Vibrio rotiferianus]